MNWVKYQILEIDDGIDNKKIDIIETMTHDDLVRNGLCSETEYERAIKFMCNDNNYNDLRKRIKSVIKISYNLLGKTN